jgi:hypothetical protein
MHLSRALTIKQLRALAAVARSESLTRAAATLGPEGVDALAGLPLEQALQPFALVEQEKLGSDLLTVYEARP